MWAIKFFTKFILSLINNNWGKIIMISIILISFHFAGTFQDTETQANVIDMLNIKKDSSEYLYVYAEVNYPDSYKVRSLKKQDIINGQIIIKDYSGYNVALWIVFVAFLISFIFCLFEEDGRWEFKDTWREAFSSLIYCELENGQYAYIALGRLIGIHDQRYSRNNILYNLDINGFDDLWLCPKYKTKSQNRESKLKDLGV